MKLKKIIEAKEAVERLSKKNITDYRKAREIVKLRKAVAAEFDFYCEEEKKAIDLYAEKTEEGTPAFLEDGRLIRHELMDTAAIDTECEELLQEMDVVAGLIQKCINELTLFIGSKRTNRCFQVQFRHLMAPGTR